MTDLQQTHAVFGTTQWTLLASLRSGDTAAAAEASDLLMKRYWPAVYSYLRGHGITRNEAAELTQAFFTDVVLGRRLLDRAEPNCGRLRNYILTAVERFRIDQHRRMQVRGGHVVLSMDAIDMEEKHNGDPAPPLPHERFIKRWAVAALEEALVRCETHYRTSGKVGHWQLFEQRVLAPAMAGGAAPALASVIQQCGFTDAASAAAAIQTVKKRAIALLREVVAETLDDASMLDDEVNQLQNSLGLVD